MLTTPVAGGRWRKVAAAGARAWWVMHLGQHGWWTIRVAMQQAARHGFGAAAMRGALRGIFEHARAGMWLGKGKQQQPYSRQPELATSLPRGEDRSSIMLSGGL